MKKYLTFFKSKTQLMSKKKINKIQKNKKIKGYSENQKELLDIKNITKINSIGELEIRVMESNKGYIGNTEIQPKNSNSYIFQKGKEETRWKEIIKEIIEENFFEVFIMKELSYCQAMLMQKDSH